MKLPSISYIITAWRQAFERFPEAIIAAILATGLGIFMIHEGTPDNHVYVFKLFLSLVVFFPFYISVAILDEVYDLKGPKRLLVTLVLMVLMLLYMYFYAPQSDIYRHVYTVQFFIFMVISHLMVSFLPYLKNDNLDDFWEYNRSLFLNFFVGALYAAIIMLGIFAALGAIIYLFDADIDGEYFGDTAAISAGILHTGYFLSSFPKKYSFAPGELRHDKMYVNLVKYILISLVCLYLVILYAFGIKILVTWELPKGFVASLVLGFSIIGLLTYLLNYRLPELEGSGWVKAYRKWFFYLLLPVISLLFVGIWRRISEYGFTEERYFVLVAGVFLATICIYFIISKKDDIRVIPIAFTICCLITALGGPIGAFGVSKKSQYKKLVKQLETAGITKDGVIVSDPEKITFEQSNEIESSIRFFTDRQYFKSLGQWINLSDSSNLESRKVFRELQSKFSLNNLKKEDADGKKRIKHFRKETFEPAQITGYDYHRFLENVNGNTANVEALTLSLSKGNKTLDVYENKELIDQINLTDFIGKLNTNSSSDYKRLSSELMTIEHSGQVYDYKIVVDYFQLEADQDGYSLMNLNLYWRRK